MQITEKCMEITYFGVKIQNLHLILRTLAQS
jgi:hypothetical protein